MSDRPIVRPGDTGDGDNYDPDVHDPDMSRPADVDMSGSQADGSIGFDGIPGDDTERASEVDDVEATEGASGRQPETLGAGVRHLVDVEPWPRVRGQHPVRPPRSEKVGRPLVV